MIKKTIAERVLLMACSTGADFAELFAENTHSSSVFCIDSKIDSIRDNTICGVGIRAFLGTKTVFASTCDISENGLMKCAANVAAAIKEKTTVLDLHLTEKYNRNINPVITVPDESHLDYKTYLLKTGDKAARGYDKRITQVQCSISDTKRNILIANTEGLYTTDRSVRTRYSLSAIASSGNENQSGFYGPGRMMGLEMFDFVKPEEVALRAASKAITNLEADYCPAGKMTVAIDNGFGGVIFHEACGHSLEATSVAVGTSQMAGKLGQKIANEKVTAIDDGSIPNAWGSLNIDDEGNLTRKNVLIEKGILKNYMIDRLGSRRMNMPVTGNSRRQNYTYEPTSRMTNTYIDNGPDDNKDIIESIEYGLYAKEMGGGSVNPLTGAFNFAVSEGYIVRNGKICEAVRGASLIGKGSEILQNIDMVGKNLERGQGMCGSASGSIPTDVGQPLIRVSSITVGGRKV